MPLNDARVRALPFSDRQCDYPDDLVRGLFVRSGKHTKSFMLTVRRAGKRERTTLGHYPELSLAKARELARDRLAEARLAKAEPGSMRFSEALEQFNKIHIPTMRPSTRKQALRCLGHFPSLMHRRLGDIKTSEIAVVLDAVQKPAERFNRFVYLRVFLNWCHQREWLDQNPISRLKRPKGSQPRERVLSDEELVKVWNTASEGDFGAFMRLLILSAQRKGQWYAFTPDLIDHGNRLIIWPGSLMKAGKPHAIPLTDTILRTIGNHRFDSFKEQTRKAQLMTDSQTTGWTLHDLRRTASTRMAELGVAPHVIERLLAHAMPRIAGTYNRASYLPEMREALIKWETRIQTLVSTMEATSV